MQVSYSVFPAVVAVGNSSNAEMLVKFKGDTGEGGSVRRPLNLSVVIDRSGSMAGTPLKYAIKAAQNLVSRMTEDDTLSVVIYDDNVETILTPQKVTDQDKIKELIGGIRAGGCTNLHGGWAKGCEHVKANQSDTTINRVLLLTDGQANAGLCDSQKIIAQSHKQEEAGISTTTLGFGSGFNEDLLIGMANSSSGNFYFIQSPDDAADVFRIEMESLTSTVAQNLIVTVEPADGVEIASIFSNYKIEIDGKKRKISVGDVYSVEDKLLALEFALDAHNDAGSASLAKLSYIYTTAVDKKISDHTGDLAASVTFGSQADADSATPEAALIEQLNKLRIAKAKEEAVELADKGDFAKAAEKLNNTVEALKARVFKESFELLEEIDHLEHFAKELAQHRFDNDIRKEMRDQSYQAMSRSRKDLSLRGVASGSSASLTTVTEFDQGVIVKCVREGGKLRMHVTSDGFNHDFNVQFPRHLREEGVTYIVEEVKESSDGSFYRASGDIRRLLMPGEVVRSRGGGARRSSSSPPKPSKAPATVADLETTDTVGTGVLVQCVKDGSKLRARVVSDGYNPDHNMRFPRSIREEGILYVVEEVIDGPGGTSYIACGKIKKFVQP